MLKAFLSYRYTSKGESIARGISVLLRPLDIQIIDGKRINAAEPLSPQIAKRIDSSHFIISLRVDDDPNDWLSTEAGFGLGRDKPVIVVTESDLAPGSGGLIGHHYHISLKNGIFEAAGDLIETIRKIQQWNGLASSPTQLCHSDPDEIRNEQWPLEVLDRIFDIREKFNNLDFKTAFKEASELYNDHPQCWRAAIAISACHIQLKHFDQAQQILDQIINNFVGNARALSYAFQNKGGLLSEECEHRAEHPQEVVEERIGYFRTSLRFEPRIEVYVNLIQDLLKLNRVEEADRELRKCLIRFPRAAEEFRKRVEQQGPEFVQEICKSDWLAALVFSKKGK